MDQQKGIEMMIDLQELRRQRRKSRHRPSPCRCGTGCGVRDGLCEPHRERLAAIREELDAEGGWNRTALRSASLKFCENDGCWNPRAVPLPVCSACAEEDGE